MNLPFTLKISFFYIENSAKKIKIGIHKSGTGGGPAFYEFYSPNSVFFLIDGFPYLVSISVTCTERYFCRSKDVSNVCNCPSL